MTLPLKAPPESICILRLSAIGDVMHMVPVVRTLQSQWPQTSITWIIGKTEAALVSDLPGVEFIIFDKATGFKGLANLRRQLRDRRFSVLLHMQVALRASLISLMIKASIKLGFDRKRAHDYQWLFTNHQIDAVPQQHVLDGFFEFLKKLGIEKREMLWDIPVTDSDKQFIQQQVPSQQPLLVINPCSSVRRNNWRNWPSKHYAAIIDYATEQLNARVVLTGGPSDNEQAIATEVAALTNNTVINLVGRTSLKQLLALLEKASAVIAPDTGPAHMATAVNTPVIGLFASSNPKRTGPYLSQEWLVNRYPDAANQFLQKREDELAWGQRIRDPQVMDLVTIEDVTNKLNLLFSTTETSEN